jgi:hypothetical protein
MRWITGGKPPPLGFVHLAKMVGPDLARIPTWAMVAIGVIADKDRFWAEMVCPLLTLRDIWPPPKQFDLSQCGGIGMEAYFLKV